MSKLYQCPYSKATLCDLTEPCLGCETFGEFENKINNALGGFFLFGQTCRKFYRRTEVSHIAANVLQYE